MSLHSVIANSRRLTHSADFHGRVLVCAIETSCPRLLQNYPVHSVLRPEPVEVSGMKFFPRGLILNLLEPMLRQGREHADRAAVLYCVRETAAFRETTEAVLILPRQVQKCRIHCE